MQLHTARLCLDCQEVHDGKNICPICGSESFAYISRWIPASERRVKPRAVEDPQAEVYRQLLSPDRAQPAAVRWLKRGVFGLAAVSAAAWMLKWGAAEEQPGPARPPKPPTEPVKTS